MTAERCKLLNKNYKHAVFENTSDFQGEGFTSYALSGWSGHVLPVLLNFLRHPKSIWCKAVSTVRCSYCLCPLELPGMGSMLTMTQYRIIKDIKQQKTGLQSHGRSAVLGHQPVIKHTMHLTDGNQKV